ncbi:MAG: aminomethyl transferase family protein [Chloroflexi bacterium]|nr:aminomethyl transferase family protein [Chloroflexota bacterium]MBT5893476.1 aminomethyl transferase family protein [Chloroflexota bacterium]
MQQITSQTADTSQLDALADGCGMFMWEGATVISHTGPDALDLLHRLTTKDLLSVGTGRSCRTALTSAKGRVIDVFLVAHILEDELLLVSDSSNSDRLVTAIDYFTIIEDAELTNRTDQSTRISLVGPSARAVAAAGMGVKIDLDDAVQVSIYGDLVQIISDSSRGVEWVDVICKDACATRLSESLTTGGAMAVDQANFEHFRINAAIPGSDREYGEHANPIEAHLLHLIDWDKGCYVGQEVIARLDAYDKVQRNVRVLVSDIPLSENVKLTADSKPAGVVTSSSQLATSDGHYLSLALIRMAHLEPDTELMAGEVVVRVR